MSGEFEKWLVTVRDTDWFHAYGDVGKMKLAWVEASRQAQAVTVERCVGAFRSGYDQALDDGCDANGAYECAIEEVAALSPDPNFLARERLKARLDEALLADNDSRIEELERELAAFQHKTEKKP